MDGVKSEYIRGTAHDVLEIKPERSNIDGVDMSRGGTGNMLVEGC